jgi:hypothetical protein
MDGESVHDSMEMPHEDSAERFKENISKRNWYHACHTGSRVLAVDVEGLLTAISIKPNSASDMQHPKLNGIDGT